MKIGHLHSELVHLLTGPTSSKLSMLWGITSAVRFPNCKESLWSSELWLPCLHMNERHTSKRWHCSTAWGTTAHLPDLWWEYNGVGIFLFPRLAKGDAYCVLFNDHLWEVPAIIVFCTTSLPNATHIRVCLINIKALKSNDWNNFKSEWKIMIYMKN